MAIWDITISNKPRRKGEVFVKRHDKFVMKLYKDSGIDPLKMGRYLCSQLNRLEAEKAANELDDAPKQLNFVFTSGSVDFIPEHLQGRRYHTIKE